MLMSILEKNIEMLSILPEESQIKIYSYLVDNFGNISPFAPLSKEEILAELKEARECYDRGEYKDFDLAVDEMCEKYGI